MYSYTNILLWVNCLGGYMSVSPNTSNSFKHSVHSIHSERVKHFEPLGLSSSLKEIDFNALQCSRRSRIKPIEPLELLR